MIGEVKFYAKATVPTGYLLANGQAVSRATYADLYAIIGTLFGTGDGSTTFNVPDIGAKTIFGYDSGDSDFNSIGKTGGAATANWSHSHTMDSHGHSYSSTNTGTPSGTKYQDSGSTVAGTSDNHVHAISSITVGSPSATSTDSQLSSTQNILMESLTLYPLIQYAEVSPIAGEVEAYAGATAPTNFLICDGSAVSRTTYSELYALIGTTFGTGDGSTTFNVPNLSGRVPFGYKSGDSNYGTVGNTAGNTGNTVNIAHSHTQTSHTHTISGTTDAVASGYRVNVNNTSGSICAWYNHTHTFSATSSAPSDTGTNSQLSSTQSIANPYIVMNYVIRYKSVITKAVSESITVTGAILKKTVRPLTEAITATASMVSRFIWTKVISESITVTGAIIKKTVRSITDGLSVTPAIIKKSKKVLSEAISVSDVFDWAMVYLKVITDYITVTSSFWKKPIKIVSESVTVTVGLMARFIKILTESITITPSFSTYLFKIKIFLENIIVTHSFMKKPKRTLSEAITVTQTLGKKIRKIFLYTFTLTESYLNTATLRDKMIRARVFFKETFTPKMNGTGEKRRIGYNNSNKPKIK